MAFDLVVRGATIVDGSGGPPVVADIGIAGDRIAAIGPIEDHAAQSLECGGLTVTPGFVNVLSHAYVSVLVDPRSLSDLAQGVTTEVFGEGYSMGPWTEEMHARFVEQQAAGRFDVPWRRLSEYLAHCEHRGVAQNVASFIGATTLRVHAVGHADRPPTEAELDLMRNLVAEEMADGALGIGSALIYAPGFFASTEELVELCSAAAPYGGRYISHLRSEGNAFLASLDELVAIAGRAGVGAEVYHLKAAGPDNWPKMDAAIERIEGARAAGLDITADVYPYTAGATALASAIPPWFHDGGLPALFERLDDPGQRRQMAAAIRAGSDGWENLYAASGGAEGVLLLSVTDPELRPWQGRTVASIAVELGLDPVDALLEIVARDGRYVGAAYFIISEDNLRRQLQLPWVSVGSDAQSIAPEGEFLATSTHPRTYGTFARVLGRYARDEGVLTFEEAVRRMTSLPCDTLGLRDRGRVAVGCYADLVVLDPASVQDTATYESPHSLASGVRDVIVNGCVTWRDGAPTGALAGRALAGPGRR